MSGKDHIAVKFRAYPTEEQAWLIDRTIGCARFVYNLMLETRIAHYQTTWESCRPTPALYKDTYPFLREVDSFALCNAQLRIGEGVQEVLRGQENRFSEVQVETSGQEDIHDESVPRQHRIG